MPIRKSGDSTGFLADVAFTRRIIWPFAIKLKRPAEPTDLRGSQPLERVLVIPWEFIREGCG